MRAFAKGLVLVSAALLGSDSGARQRWLWGVIARGLVYSLLGCVRRLGVGSTKCILVGYCCGVQFAIAAIAPSFCSKSPDQYFKEVRMGVRQLRSHCFNTCEKPGNNRSYFRGLTTNQNWHRKLLLGTYERRRNKVPEIWKEELNNRHREVVYVAHNLGVGYLTIVLWNFFNCVEIRIKAN